MAKDTPEEKKRYLTIGQLLSVLSMVAAGTWAISMLMVSGLRNDLAQYESADKWEMPAILSAVKYASDKLAVHLSTLNTIEELERAKSQLSAQLEEAKRRVADIEATIKPIQKQLEESREFISRLYPGTYQISVLEDAATTLAGHEISIGIKSVMPSNAEAVINGKPESVTAGSVIPVQTSLGGYRVIVKKISFGAFGDPSVDFLVVSEQATNALDLIKSRDAHQ